MMSARAAGFVALWLVACTIEVVDPTAAPPAPPTAPADTPPPEEAPPAVVMAEVVAPPTPSPGKPGPRTTPAPPAPVPEPPPPVPGTPPPVGPDLEIRSLVLDADGTSIVWEVANVGPDFGVPTPAPLLTRVKVEVPGQAEATVVVDVPSQASLVAGQGVRQGARLAPLLAQRPQLRGVPLRVSVLADPLSVLQDPVRTNNERTLSVTLGAPPVIMPMPPGVPVPVQPVEPPPAALPPTATSRKVTLRVRDGAWANVYVDGALVWAPKNFATEHVVDLTIGSHLIEVKDFMDGDTWSRGLLVVNDKDLVLGLASEQQVEVYNDPGAFTPR